jgi:hypothetical protein
MLILIVPCVLVIDEYSVSAELIIDAGDGAVGDSLSPAIITKTLPNKNHILQNYVLILVIESYRSSRINYEN